MNSFAKDQPLYIFCRSGNRAKQAAAKLEKGATSNAMSSKAAQWPGPRPDCRSLAARAKSFRSNDRCASRRCRGTSAASPLARREGNPRRERHLIIARIPALGAGLSLGLLGSGGSIEPMPDCRPVRCGLAGLVVRVLTGFIGVAKYRAALEKIVAARAIETRFRHHLVEVRGAAREAVIENLDTQARETIRFDLLHVTPPMSAPDFIRSSPLADANGWVEVDKHTLQHSRFLDIFALGDASSLATSKTGAAIRKQAPVLVANLLAHRAGRCPLPARYDGNPAETFPFNQAKERWSMYLLKRYLLPQLYWHGMLKGLA